MGVTKKAKPGKASSAAKSTRKSHVFSVSMSPDEVNSVDARVSAISRKSGLKFSRNEYMRKAALAADAYFRALESGDETPDFQQIFTSVE